MTPQDWDRQTSVQIVSVLCGFITILVGTWLLHATKDHGEIPVSLSECKDPT